MNLLIRSSCLLIIFLWQTFHTYGQYDVSYTPMDSLGAEKEELIREIDSDLKSLRTTLPKSIRGDVMDVYERRAELLTSLLETNYFINDDALTQLTQRIYKEITTRNPRDNYPTRILIARSPVVNASCWGEGTMVINLGLLNRVQSEDELAFVMAHEMAHQVLDHVYLRLKNNLEARDYRSVKRQIQESGRLATYRSLIYSTKRYTRENERQADSLAITLLKNTSYNWSDYRPVLQMLDSSDYPKYRQKPSVETTFNFSKYPFQDQWLNPPRSAFGSRTSSSDAFFNTDSLKSHPDIEERIAYLQTQFPATPGGRSSVFSTDHQQRIDLEMAYSTFILEDYGKSLFYTLQLLEHYPQNKFLKSLLANLCFNLYEARKDHTFSRYVLLSNHYPPLMDDVHVFLNNLRVSELANIAFNYLNRDEIFDEGNEEHYLWLWQVSNGLNFEELCAKIAHSYREQFPEGKLQLK